MSASRQFAIVTGASTGIGLELAKCCARDGFDLLIAADEAEIDNAAVEIRKLDPRPRARRRLHVCAWPRQAGSRAGGTGHRAYAEGLAALA